MVTTTAVLDMALVALGMVLTPGPNMIYLISRSIGQGWRAGMVSLGGTMVGFVVYMTMANVGLSAVFVLVPGLFVGLKLVGAAYLLHLAWKTLRPGGRSPFETVTLPRDSRSRLFRMGLVTNLLNPKAAIMYLALVPQFVDPSRGAAMAQAFVLGGVQITVSAVVNTAIVLAAGGIAAFLAGRPTWMAWQRRVTGTLLGAVGVKLALAAPAPANA
ncbi:LysE family translocator [Occultella kanbiaonis]|uniref:LysE family translocator n=1 Tax=Occultella kanbiaonis TaxID=2675754 RepID=UPI0012BA2454|nr:LysE family translocator [Occultella kanbiaonis]